MANGVYRITEEFERQLSDYTGAPYAVTVDNMSNALFLSLYYENHVKKSIDGKVSIPCRTYPSVPCEIIHAGLKVEFEPVEGKTIKGMYQLKGSNVWDSALTFTADMYKKGQHICVSFTGPYKHFKLSKGGAILTDSLDAYHWFKRARYNSKIEMIKKFGGFIQESSHRAGDGFPEELIGIKKSLEEHGFEDPLLRDGLLYAKFPNDLTEDEIRQETKEVLELSGIKFGGKIEEPSGKWNKLIKSPPSTWKGDYTKGFLSKDGKIIGHFSENPLSRRLINPTEFKKDEFFTGVTIFESPYILHIELDDKSGILTAEEAHGIILVDFKPVYFSAYWVDEYVDIDNEGRGYEIIVYETKETSNGKKYRVGAVDDGGYLETKWATKIKN